MSILENAKQHYKDALSKEPLKLDVPEWDAVVYVRPKISLEKAGEILELAQSGKTAEAMAMTLVLRLIDDSGQPLFRRADKVTLLKSVDPEVMGRIVNEINEFDPSAEEVEGN